MCMHRHRHTVICRLLISLGSAFVKCNRNKYIFQCFYGQSHFSTSISEHTNSDIQFALIFYSLFLLYLIFFLFTMQLKKKKKQRWEWIATNYLNDLHKHFHMCAFNISTRLAIDQHLVAKAWNKKMAAKNIQVYSKKYDRCITFVVLLSVLMCVSVQTSEKERTRVKTQPNHIVD